MSVVVFQKNKARLEGRPHWVCWVVMVVYKLRDTLRIKYTGIFSNLIARDGLWKYKVRFAKAPGLSVITIRSIFSALQRPSLYRQNNFIEYFSHLSRQLPSGDCTSDVRVQSTRYTSDLIYMGNGEWWEPLSNENKKFSPTISSSIRSAKKGNVKTHFSTSA